VLDEVLRATDGCRRIALTTHRRESLGETMRQNLRVLHRFVEARPDTALIFPVHPNPSVVEAARTVLSDHPRIHLIDPLGYRDFIHLLAQCWLIASDSGGVQEEAPTLGKPVLILRENTERPEAIEAGVARLVGGDPQRLAAMLDELDADPSWVEAVASIDNPFGRGDSAQRVLGRGPMAARPLAHAVPIIRDLAGGRSATYGTVELELPWAAGQELPVWIAGYEPVVLGMAGRSADGVIVGLSDPALVAWMAGLARDAAADVGRDPTALRVAVAVPGYVGEPVAGRERVGWFVTAVAEHVAEVLDHYPIERLPASLRGLVHDDPVHDASFPPGVPLPAEVVDRFAIVGPVEEHVRRLLELRDVGVGQVNLYLSSGDEEAQIEAYGRDVIPAFREASARG
jgi:hypothetical protein